MLFERFGLLQFSEFIDPPLVLGVADFRAHKEAANNRPDQVVALLFCSGDIGERARQSFTGEDRQHADFIALQIGHHLAEIAGDRLHMVTEQRGHRLAAAFKGDIAHFMRVDVGFLRQQRRFHPVLAADGGPGANHDTGGIFLHRGHKRLQIFPWRIGAHGDHAVVGADARQPAHVIDAVTAEFTLRQV